ncbi:dUTP diphosphatase [Ralstonia phage RP13]|nr:dUTP diphosphatase [Ralstonia phage RP13]
MKNTVKVQILHNSALAALPKYETEGAAAMDLQALISEPIHISPGHRALIKTGIKVALPVGWKFNVLPRSGNAYKKGITVLNSPGLIDSDYRGDIGVILINTSDEAFTVLPGDRIAQLELAPVYTVEWDVVDELGTTNRGEGGFGSTGLAGK